MPRALPPPPRGQVGGPRDLPPGGALAHPAAREPHRAGGEASARLRGLCKEPRGPGRHYTAEVSWGRRAEFRRGSRRRRAGGGDGPTTSAAFVLRSPRELEPRIGGS